MSDRFVLSELASADLDEILEYVLDRDGPRRAEHVLTGLYEAFKKLAEWPHLGHSRSDLTSAPVRFYAVWSFLVIYKPDTAPIEIVRVLHGARDVEAVLRES